VTRAKISEYSATAGDNTDVNGVNIAEGCPPSSMNNMGREIMAALKRFQVGSDGDGVTVGGALVVSGATTIANTATLGNVDINGGTIDGTTIGGASAAAGTFTTLTASSPSVISVNSASDALRITQVGAGNALVVEDSANPDATPFVIDNGGNVVVGALTRRSDFDAAFASTVPLQVEGTSAAGISITRNNAAASSGYFVFAKSRGTALGAVTAVQNNDLLGSVLFEGADGVGLVAAASIAAAVDGTPGTNDMPGRLTFSTTADGASTPTERMRIDSSGRVGIGTTSPSTNAILTVNGNIAVAIPTRNAASSNQIGVWTSDDPVDNTRSRITFATTAGASSSNSYIAFSTNNYGVSGGERMRIDPDGNLLVGTTSATNNSRLKVQGSSTSGSDYCAQFTKSDGANILFLKNDGSTISDGTYNSTTANAANVFISGSAQLQRSTSSLKYKTDVQDATHGLTEVMALRPVTYKGKNDGDKVFGGLIAEEVHEAGLTEFVQYADDGSPDALAYGHMVSLAFKAIQEQQAIIESLKTRIETLENK
jgi:hypothetical protein